jgi:hypothetical protein
MSDFYTYLHCRPDGTPFYVGKGSGRRAYQFAKNRNHHYKNVILKYGIDNIKVFVSPCESEAVAFIEETRQIQLLREAGYELTNQTEGGEGPSGFSHSDTTKKQLSKSHTGKKFTDEHKARIAEALRGKKRPPFSDEWKSKLCTPLRMYEITPEVRAKLSEKSKGNKNSLGLKRGPMSDAHKAKVSAAKKGRAPWNKGLTK